MVPSHAKVRYERKCGENVRFADIAFAPGNLLSIFGHQMVCMPFSCNLTSDGVH
jgi:hypothetical protein